MKILVTGANGYIGTRLIPILLREGHEVIALVRRPKRFDIPSEDVSRLTSLQGDLLDPDGLKSLPADIEAAYYLVHSMSDSKANFSELELSCVHHFLEALKSTRVRQVIYLGGMSHDTQLSTHLKSRKAVEDVIIGSGIPYTIFHSGIIVGSGSASFEIIRDLVEKLPVMVAPKWLNSKTQPIAIDDVLYYLSQVLGNEKALGQVLEIGGPDTLSYKEMLMSYAKVRGLKRWIFTVPVLTPRLSSYWLYFVTSTNFQLASGLVDSMRNDTTCHSRLVDVVLPHTCLSYSSAVKAALSDCEANHVTSSWRDALVISRLKADLKDYIGVPTNGCFVDSQIFLFATPHTTILDRLWAIGGHNGWYFANWTWRLRGFIDKLFGGAGLDRGRTHPTRIEAGDVIDFWRVLVADRSKGRLLLYAEMKMPGEAWLEFIVTPKGEKTELKQTATFRPKGLLGRLYWYSLYPIHSLIFRGMPRQIGRT